MPHPYCDVTILTLSPGCGVPWIVFGYGRRLPTQAGDLELAALDSRVSFPAGGSGHPRSRRDVGARAEESALSQAAPQRFDRGRGGRHHWGGAEAVPSLESRAVWGTCLVETACGMAGNAHAAVGSGRPRPWAVLGGSALEWVCDWNGATEGAASGGRSSC